MRSIQSFKVRLGLRETKISVRQDILREIFKGIRMASYSEAVAFPSTILRRLGYAKHPVLLSRLGLRETKISVRQDILGEIFKCTRTPRQQSAAKIRVNQRDPWAIYPHTAWPAIAML